MQVGKLIGVHCMVMYTHTLSQAYACQIITRKAKLCLIFKHFQAYPQEKVGVFARRGKGGPLAVVEYSELDHSLAHAINQESGRLRFNWSNVCFFFCRFSQSMLQPASALMHESVPKWKYNVLE